MEFPSRNLIIIIICIVTCDDGKLVDILSPRILSYIVPNGNESLKFREAKKTLPTNYKVQTKCFHFLVDKFSTVFTP